MQLYYRQSGSEHHPALLFLHGLFGSSVNWSRIVRHFESDYHCIVPDLRNHGRSPQDPDVSYQAMVADLEKLMLELSLDSAHFVGHSMGGKVAMLMALTLPHRVNSLVVVDISPLNYAHSFSGITSALRQLDLQSLQKREQADAQLAASIQDKAVRAYLLQNLVRSEGRWMWRMNLDYLQAGVEQVVGFPRLQGHAYPGDTLFLHGERSDYVDRAGREAAVKFFPNAGFVEIRNAGHWVYAEQPEMFIRSVEGFLEQTGQAKMQ